MSRKIWENSKEKISTFCMQKQAYLRTRTEKKRKNNTHAINQGVRGAEPPDAGKFLKSSYQVLENSYLWVVRGEKFWKFFSLLLLKISVDILLFY